MTLLIIISVDNFVLKYNCDKLEITDVKTEENILMNDVILVTRNLGNLIL